MVSKSTKPKVLFIHQGGELYGSDKVFAQTIRCAYKIVEPIVLLSSNGPLVHYLLPYSKAIYVKELGVLRRKYLSFAGIVCVVWYMIRSTVFICQIVKREGIRGIYTNTIGILSGAIAAKLYKLPHVWHVHEIITSPKAVSRFFSWIVPKLSSLILCNSMATRNHLLAGKTSGELKCRVIHNGVAVDRFAEANTRQKARSSFQLNHHHTFVGVIGRIHHWKGQDYFLQAAGLLKNCTKDVFFGIIGGVYDAKNDNQIAKLRVQAKKLGIEDKVILADFRERIEDVYAALDIIVVPSKFPEPFGLTTIEAMAAKKPVIATSHGGSLEIVEDGITGFLVPVDNPEVLAEKIRVLVENPAMRKNMGLAGHRRVQERFNEERFNDEMEKLLMEGFPNERVKNPALNTSA